jgi:hypothetical protein
MIRVAAAFVLSLLLAAAAQAHTRSQSFSTWTVNGATLDGVFQVDAYRATQLSETPRDLDVLLRDHLTETVTLTQDGARCTLAPPQALPAPRGDVRMRLVFTCPRPLAEAPANLSVGAFFPVSISHVHYVRVTEPNGLSESVLTGGRTQIAVGRAEAAPSSTFTSFLTLGFEHVLSGVDHIAFLIALAMLAGGPWRILIAVTGFTLGHSLTLALVAFNVLRPDTAAVEALIGFTVAWAAGDALARARNVPRWYGLVGAAGIVLLPLVAAVTSLPVLSLAVIGGVALFAATMSYARNLDAPYVAPAIATIFGLAHGAGFAGPLLEMEIPSESLVWTLLAFNLGVEFAQLTALGVLGGLLWLARRVVTPIPAVAYDASASVLFALGTFWFVSRALS